MKKIKKPDPIIIEAYDKKGELVMLQIDFVSSGTVDQMSDMLQSDEFSKTPGEGTAKALAIVFGKKAEYFKNNFDIRVLTNIMTAFREEYSGNPSETQDT